jgi:hypothetical protein
MPLSNTHTWTGGQIKTSLLSFTTSSNSRAHTPSVCSFFSRSTIMFSSNQVSRAVPLSLDAHAISYLARGPPPPPGNYRERSNYSSPPESRRSPRRSADRGSPCRSADRGLPHFTHPEPSTSRGASCPPRDTSHIPPLMGPDFVFGKLQPLTSRPVKVASTAAAQPPETAQSVSLQATGSTSGSDRGPGSRWKSKKKTNVAKMKEMMKRVRRAKSPSEVFKHYRREAVKAARRDQEDPPAPTPLGTLMVVCPLFS